MSLLLQINWHDMFVPSTSLLEIIIRGSIMYLILFILLRIMRRDAGGLNIMDVLLIVLIADAAQNGMAGEHKSITEGTVLLGTIGFWNYFLDWISYKIPKIRPLFDPAPFPLIQNGRILRKNLRREMITEDDLMGQLRLQGVDDVKMVKSCMLEGDGRISVVKMEQEITPKQAEVMK